MADVEAPSRDRSLLLTTTVSMIVFLRADDIDAENSWKLLEWCTEHGGAEFFVRRMSLEGLAEPNIQRATDALAPFQLKPAIRQRTVVYENHLDSELTDLWSLSAESIRALRPLFSDGLFTSPSYDKGGWLEEPTVYRAGRVLLGVVSHEEEAFMDLSEPEVEELRVLGYRLRENGVWLRDR